MDTRELLNTEIESEFEAMSDVEMSSNEYKVGVEGLTKLIDRQLEFEKLDEEFREKREVRKLEEKIKEKDLELREKELKLKEEQLRQEQKDSKFRNGIAIAGIAIPSLITIWGTIKSLKFEETGTVTTMMGRGFINKLLPKK